MRSGFFRIPPDKNQHFHMVLFRNIDYCIDMKPLKAIVAIVSLCLTIATGGVFATTPLLHVRQDVCGAGA